MALLSQDWKPFSQFKGVLVQPLRDSTKYRAQTVHLHEVNFTAAYMSLHKVSGILFSTCSEQTILQYQHCMHFLEVKSFWGKAETQGHSCSILAAPHAPCTLHKANKTHCSLTQHTYKAPAGFS